MMIFFGVNSVYPIGTEQCTTLRIVDDNIAESTEIFTVTATGGDFVNGQDSIQVIIVDNDGEKNR